MDTHVSAHTWEKVQSFFQDACGPAHSSLAGPSTAQRPEEGTKNYWVQSRDIKKKKRGEKWHRCVRRKQYYRISVRKVGIVMFLAHNMVFLLYILFEISSILEERNIMDHFVFRKVIFKMWRKMKKGQILEPIIIEQIFVAISFAA